MKKIAIIVTALFCFTKGNACDICGCGVGGYYIGILPEFNKHVFGLRYRLNSIKTHIGPGGSTTYLTSEENYQTIELWGGWNIGSKFRLMVAAPYSINERINQGITKTKNGIGDMSVNGYYLLLNKAQEISEKKNLLQTLWIGGGIKLPTGKYLDEDKQNTAQNANLFQLGTGSFDLSLNMMYDVRLQDAGLNISAGYKMNTANKYEYRYGNKLTTSAQAYYKVRINDKFNIAPSAGIMYEKSQKDIDDEIVVDISGGQPVIGKPRC